METISSDPSKNELTSECVRVNVMLKQWSVDSIKHNLLLLYAFIPGNSLF